MARSSASEPLEKFRFKVTFTNTGDSAETSGTVAGFHDIQVPKRTTNKGTYREGNDNDVNQLFAGLSSMEDVVLSRGLVANTGTTGTALYEWMSAVHNPSAGNIERGPASASHKYRKDVTVAILDREGKVARQWKLHNAWPVNFVPGSDLNAGEDGEKSLEQLTLAYEDFQEIQQNGTDEAKVSGSLPAATPAS